MSKEKLVPIIISIIAVLISAASFLNSRKATSISKKNFEINQKDREPNLKINQNLWTKKPRFELINESNSKLDKTPSPTYFMFIPSKLYYFDNDNNVTFSTLILSPFSYDLIQEQIVGNQTKDSIITSYLPQNFFAKKGSRDIVKGKIYKISENLSVTVHTLPFIVIISPIDYIYNSKEHQIILLSTPLENQEITTEDLKNIKDYTRDNFQNLEVKIDGDKNIYETAQINVEHQLAPLIENKDTDNIENTAKILGGSEDGKGYGFILKKVNQMISPLDPMEKSN